MTPITPRMPNHIILGASLLPSLFLKFPIQKQPIVAISSPSNNNGVGMVMPLSPYSIREPEGSMANAFTAIKAALRVDKTFFISLDIYVLCSYIPTLENGK